MSKEKKHYLPRLEKLRVSLTQACNLKCEYCHHEGQITPRKEVLSFDELSGLMDISCEYGVDQIKYSGGEPLLYKSLSKLIRLNKKNDIAHVSITTNGILLEDKVDELIASGVDEINITLDTLNPSTYTKLCRGSEQDLAKVLRGIKRIYESGYENFSINSVMTSRNLVDIPSLEEFCKSLGKKLRLITFVEISGTPESKNLAKSSNVNDLILQLREAADKQSGRETARESLTKDGGQLEIVHSCTDCDICGRNYPLRLTTDGKLKPCLSYEIAEIDVITPSRQKKLDEVRFRFEQAIALKKYGLVKYFFQPKRHEHRSLLSESE